jgi:insecticidal toxin complex protein TccC
MRYYPAWLCRWINPDPAGTIDGLNLYAFVSGNPVTHKDIGGMGISLDKRHSSVASKKAGKKGAKKYFLTKGISRFTNSGKYKYYYKGRIVQKEFKKRNFGYKITNLDRPSGWPKYVTKELAKKFPGAINKKFKVKSGDVVCHHKQWMVIKKGFQTNFRGKTLDDINAELINSTGVTFNYPKLKKSFLAAIENGKPASRAKKSNPAKKTKRLPKASMVEAIGIMIRDEYYDPNNLFMESYAPATGPNNSSLGATAGNYIISLQNDYKGLSKKPLTTTDRKTRYNEILKASFDFPKNFVDPSTGTSMPAPSMTTNAKKQFLKEAYKLWD